MGGELLSPSCVVSWKTADQLVEEEITRIRHASKFRGRSILGGEHKSYDPYASGSEESVITGLGNER